MFWGDGVCLVLYFIYKGNLVVFRFYLFMGVYEVKLILIVFESYFWILIGFFVYVSFFFIVLFGFCWVLQFFRVVYRGIRVVVRFVLECVCGRVFVCVLYFIILVWRQYNLDLSFIVVFIKIVFSVLFCSVSIECQIEFSVLFGKQIVFFFIYLVFYVFTDV